MPKNIYLVTQNIVLPSGQPIKMGTEVELTVEDHKIIITHDGKTSVIPKKMGTTMIDDGVLVLKDPVHIQSFTYDNR